MSFTLETFADLSISYLALSYSIKQFRMNKEEKKFAEEDRKREKNDYLIELVEKME